MTEALAYFLTFTTYGTWLHGRQPGAVDRQHNQPGTPFLPADERREAARRGQMRQAEYLLDADRRAVVLQTILEVSRHRGWKVWAVHVRSNHVHVVVSAAATPEKVMSDFKAWASRRLRERFAEEADRDRWTQHGSMKYLWDEQAVAAATAYVIDGQGEPMARFDGRTAPQSEPEA
jgi:REP element-mobilizing transposase RayT